MNKKILLSALAAMGMCAPAWAVYKCKGPGGGYVYQDSLCAGDGKEIDATPASGDGKPEWEKRLDESNRKEEAISKRRLAEYEKEKAAREQRDAEYETWRARQDIAAQEKADQRRKKLAASGVPCGESNIPEMPSIGMQESIFLDCTWVGRGRSETVNETVTAGGTTRQYVYKRGYGNGRYYIYTRMALSARSSGKNAIACRR